MTKVIEKQPKVNQANEFLEIANDFTDPLELVREAISNAFDANAKNINLHFEVVFLDGEDVFKIIISDDGDGMNEDDLECFFDLGNSNRRTDKEKIGEKGHGTKVYFNSKQLQVVTHKDGQTIKAEMHDIFRTLHKGQIPKYKLATEKSAKGSRGTEITILGYNQSKLNSFKHNIIKDYIYWKTKFGAFEREIGIDVFKDVTIKLKGLDRDAKDSETLVFGHIFPKESKSVNKLFEEHNEDAPHHYCKRWIKQGTLPNFPHIKFQAVFYVEGKYVKYSYNDMIKRQKWSPEGGYQIQERYGLWLCKDYIPIQKKNDWIVYKGSEFTKFHAFFNCQNFKLTANRGSVENTTPEIFQDIERVVRGFYDEITDSEDYRLLEWLEEAIVGEVSKNKEKKDFDLRKKFVQKQNIAVHKDFIFVEPQRESGVYSLVMQLVMVEKDLFPFEIIDYNTHSGLDVIVRAKSNLSLDQTQFYYVEFKNNLEKNFNHSFEYLEAIICWDTKVKDGEEVYDLQKNSRVFKISPPKKKGEHTMYFLEDDRSRRRIEVFVLKDYLKEKLNMEFRPRATKA